MAFACTAREPPITGHQSPKGRASGLAASGGSVDRSPLATWGCRAVLFCRYILAACRVNVSANRHKLRAIFLLTPDRARSVRRRVLTAACMAVAGLEILEFVLLPHHDHPVADVDE